MFKCFATSAWLAACIGLTSCSPPPPDGVPHGAHAGWTLKSDWVWTWKQTLGSGCVAWMAKDRWAAVQLILDSRCDVDRGDGYLNGRGISYSSVSDFLVFQGFWPWTQADYFDLIHFDTEGMVSHIDPCPHALAAKELDQLRALGQHALIAATTEGEKRMLTRIVDRLAATDGKSLASGQGGCTDLPPEWYNKVRPREDPWTDR